MSEVIVKLTADHIKIKGGEYVQDLVRCIDCKWYNGNNCTIIPWRNGLVVAIDFCSHGERRDQ